MTNITDLSADSARTKTMYPASVFQGAFPHDQSSNIFAFDLTVTKAQPKS